MSWLLSSMKVTANLGTYLCRPFHITAVLCAEPPKKKKKIDMSVVIGKIQKKTRRIEKEIKRYEKKGRALKPISELEGDLVAKRQISNYVREERNFDDPVSEERKRSLLLKKWSRFKLQEHVNEEQRFARAKTARDTALRELKALCPTLYDSSVQVDETMIPSEYQGPLATPPIEGYNSPDGTYDDVTQKFKYMFEIDRKLIVNPKDKRKREKKAAQ